MRVLSLLALVLVLSSPMTTCANTPVKQFKPVYWTTQSWRGPTPEDQGMDSASLAGMFEHIKANDLHLHSLLIVRNGYPGTKASSRSQNRLIVIVFTGVLEVGKEAVLLNIINDYVVPFVSSESALPSNPEASARFVSLIQGVEKSK